MKRKKTPKSAQKHYHRGYNNGVRAGKLKAAAGMVDKFRKAYPKVAKGQNVTENIPVQAAEVRMDDRVLKWQGFTDAMNLIIASKR